MAAGQLTRGRHVVMRRRALIADYQRAGVVPTADGAFDFSMWRGYLSEPYLAEALDLCRTGGAEIAYIHTSGHASAADLRAFAAAICPNVIVPVHGVKWGEESHGFGIIRRLADAEADGDPLTIALAPKAAPGFLRLAAQQAPKPLVVVRVRATKNVLLIHTGS